MVGHDVQARLDALWWVTQHPDFWIFTGGPKHLTNPTPKHTLCIRENALGKGVPVGDILFTAYGDTMDEVLDQLVAWRIARRLR